MTAAEQLHGSYVPGFLAGTLIGFVLIALVLSIGWLAADLARRLWGRTR